MAQILTTTYANSTTRNSQFLHKTCSSDFSSSALTPTTRSKFTDLGSYNVSASIRAKVSPSVRCVSSNGGSSSDNNVIEIDDGDLMEKYISEAGDKLVVINVSTTTCGPCKLISPKVVKMSAEYPDALFFKINGDKSNSTRALMRKWGIRAVPSFRFYKNGELIHTHSGAKEDLLRSHFLTHYYGAQKVA